MTHKLPPPPSSTNDVLLKGFAALQLLLALIRLIVERGNWPSVSMMIVGALAMIFCTREKVHDERVDQLKLKAGKAGLLGGTLLAMFIQLGAMLAHSTEARENRIPLGSIKPMSAFDVLIVIMMISLACFYFWRWQDGRESPTG